jgi:hypothetical protein
MQHNENHVLRLRVGVGKLIVGNMRKISQPASQKNANDNISLFFNHHKNN